MKYKYSRKEWIKRHNVLTNVEEADLLAPSDKPKKECLVCGQDMRGMSYCPGCLTQKGKVNFNHNREGGCGDMIHCLKCYPTSKPDECDFCIKSKGKHDNKCPNPEGIEFMTIGGKGSTLKGLYDEGKSKPKQIEPLKKRFFPKTKEWAGGEMFTFEDIADKINQIIQHLNSHD